MRRSQTICTTAVALVMLAATGSFEGVSGHGWIAGLGDIPGDARYALKGDLSYDTPGATG